VTPYKCYMNAANSARQRTGNVSWLACFRRLRQCAPAARLSAKQPAAQLKH
jgi:hypothetical protein